MEEAKWGPNLFSDIIHSSLFLSHPGVFDFLWSPPVSFVFLPPPIVSLVSATSLPLSVPLLSHCLSICLSCEIEVWEAAGSIRKKRERERVREGKSVRARRCERGRWEKARGEREGEGKISERKRKRGQRRRREVENVTEGQMEKEVRLNKRRMKETDEWKKPWWKIMIAAKTGVREALENIIVPQKDGSQLYKWRGTQLVDYLGYFQNFFFPNSKSSN